MKFPLFTEVRLTIDLPEYHLKKGCSAIIVDYCQNDEQEGYILEILDKKYQGYTVIAVTPNQIELVVIALQEV